MERTKTIATRVTIQFAKLIDSYMESGHYITPADFIRDAIREKIRRDAPNLYNTLFGGEEK